MKYAKVSLQVKFLYKENKVFQYFIIVDTNMKKYVLNSMYTLNRYFEDFIEKNALSCLDTDFIFVSRRNDDDRVVLEFSFSEEKNINKMSTYFYTLAGDIPFSNGCEECEHFKENDIMFCEKKEKMLASKFKKCKFYSQKR